MKTHANQTPQNASRANGHAIADTENRSEATFQFVDNRPETAAQRKLNSGLSKIKPIVLQPKSAIKSLNTIENAQKVVQRGIHSTYYDKNADENDLAIAKMLAKDLEGIVEEAAARVDNGKGLTNSSKAYYDDNGSKAAAAKRGTAIHFEAYDIIDDQLDGYGAKEKKCIVGSGRMDIMIKLPSNNVIVYDITSCKQAESSHTGSRGYEKEKGVIAVIEISYDDDKI